MLGQLRDIEDVDVDKPSESRGVCQVYVKRVRERVFAHLRDLIRLILFPGKKDSWVVTGRCACGSGLDEFTELGNAMRIGSSGNLGRRSLCLYDSLGESTRIVCMAIKNCFCVRIIAEQRIG